LVVKELTEKSSRVKEVVKRMRGKRGRRSIDLTKEKRGEASRW
jgi:hypothetical protein